MAKRKYTKHDYIADLDKRVPLWKAMHKEGKKIGTQFQTGKEPFSMVHDTEKEALEYLNFFTQKKSYLLNNNTEMQTLYNELQNLLSKVDLHNEKLRALFPTIAKVTANDLTYYLFTVDQFKKEQKIQQQRIRNIQAYIRHTQKQIALEKGLSSKKQHDAKAENSPKLSEFTDKPASLFKTLFSSIHSIMNMFINPRLASLERIQRKEQAEIKQIQLDLQRKAKKILREGELYFTEDRKKQLIKAHKTIKDVSRQGEELSGYLKSKLLQLKNAVLLTENQKVKEQSISEKTMPEKSVEERILQAFSTALASGKNLILKGKNRCLGLTNDIVQEISEDEQFKQDIIEHISDLLATPAGQNFGKDGSVRWKPVMGKKELFELSINPKDGHSQSMPRFYAKKEGFMTNGTSFTMITDKEKQTNNIWVLVRKGSKRTQANDTNLAEKVFFEKDGKQHQGNFILNDLDWMTKDIASKEILQQQKILKNRQIN